MSDLSSSEHHGQLDLVSLTEESLGVSHLEFVIVIFDSRAELHFLHFDRVLPFPRFAGGPLRFVPVLAVIHHLDHGRPGLGRHFYQIHSSHACPFPSFVDRDDTDLFAIVLDEPYWAYPDLIVYADSFLADL